MPTFWDDCHFPNKNYADADKSIIKYLNILQVRPA